MKNASYFERAAAWAADALKANKLPFVSALVFGFLAHMYAFTNKLLNADEISALFSKGATVQSGRWGLGLTSYIFPDLSMPWIYGLISVLLLAVAICITVNIFKIKSPVLKVLVSAAIICFPAVMGNFCFMFTSAAYALAIFMAVAAVYLFVSGGKIKRGTGVLLLALSLGIYQAYISLAASFLVLLLIRQLLDGEDAKTVLKKGIVYFLLLVAALGLYYAVTLIVDLVGGQGYQEYEFMSSGGVLASLIRAYTSFIRSFTDGYFGFVNSPLSVVAHLALMLLSLGCIACTMIKRQNWQNTALMLVLIAIFPLSMNCMYLIASVDIIHTLVLFSFISVYVLAAIVLDRAEGRALILRDVASVALALIVAGNVFYCNKVYLKMALQYENAFAFYNTLMAQIMDTPGFNSETVIDFVGSDAWGVKKFEEIDTEKLTGPNDDLVNIYTRVDFMKYYMGIDLYSYREDTIYADWYDEMPSYPDPGSIMMRPEENRIIIKLQ